MANTVVLVSAMEDKGRAVDRGRIRVTPRWFDYINLLVAFLAPALTLGPIVYLLILADQEIAPSNVESGYLQSVIPSPQLFIFGVFTYCGFLMTVALFRSESASALLAFGKRGKSIDEKIKELDGYVNTITNTIKMSKGLEDKIESLKEKVNELEEKLVKAEKDN